MDQTSLQFQNSLSKINHQFKPWIFGGLVLLSVMTIGLILWYWSSQKSIGQITTYPTVLPKKQKISLNQISYQGKYFTFSYPQGFEMESKKQPVKFPVLERQLWTKNDLNGQKIALVVQDQGTASLEENSSYQWRNLNKKAYLKENLEKLGLSITLFTESTQTPFEVDAFWLLGHNIVSIVVSSPTKNEGLRELLLGILDTLRF